LLVPGLNALQKFGDLHSRSRHYITYHLPAAIRRNFRRFSLILRFIGAGRNIRSSRTG